MEKHPTHKPTDAELEILRILWENGPSSVRLVNDQLNKRKETGYTTTLKIMQIMAEKGLVSRDTSQRTHIYQAVIPEAAVQEKLLDQVLDAAFRGSAGKLVLKVLGDHEASQTELDEIKELIRRIESERKSQ